MLVTCMPDARHLYAGVEDPDGEWEWEWGTEQEEDGACDARDMESRPSQCTPSLPCRVARGPWTSPLKPPTGAWRHSGEASARTADARLYRVADRVPSSPLHPGNPNLARLIAKPQLRAPTPRPSLQDTFCPRLHEANPVLRSTILAGLGRLRSHHHSDVRLYTPQTLPGENNLCDAITTPRSPTQPYTLPPWRTILPGWPASKRLWSRSTECPG